MQWQSNSSLYSRRRALAHHFWFTRQHHSASRQTGHRARRLRCGDGCHARRTTLPPLAESVEYGGAQTAEYAALLLPGRLLPRWFVGFSGDYRLRRLPGKGRRMSHTDFCQQTEICLRQIAFGADSGNFGAYALALGVENV